MPFWDPHGGLGIPLGHPSDTFLKPGGVISMKKRRQKYMFVDFWCIFAANIVFRRFGINFSSIFARKMLRCKNASINFILVFTVRNGSWTIFFELLLACIFGPKNLPKTLPKRGPEPPKIDAENVLFFNIVFFGFRPRFWKVLGLQLGAKSAALLAAPGVLNPTAF